MSYGQTIDFITTDTTYAGCAPFSVEFRDQSAVLNADYFWTIMETGETFEGQVPSYTFFTPGTYSIKLVVVKKDGTFRDSIIKENLITAGSEPQVDFNLLSTQDGCSPHKAVFEPNISIGHAAINSWFWDFGNGTTSIDTFPTAIYRNNINAGISLSVTDSIGCSSSFRKFIQFDVSYELPSISFDIDNPFGCDTIHTINITNNSTTNASYSSEWEFMTKTDTNYIVENNPSYTFLDTGEFNIRVTVTDSLNCIASILYEDIVKIRIPKAEYYYTNPDSCDPFLFEISDTSSIYTINWKWDFGNGDSANTINPIYSYSDTGNYNLKLITIDDYNCPDTFSQVISVEQSFYADFVSDTLISCDTPFLVNFSSLSYNASEYLWDFGNGDKDTSEHPNYTYLDNGNYSIQLTISDSNGCIHSKSVSDMIHVEDFTVDFDTSSQPFCSPGLLFSDLTQPSPLNWLWVYGDQEYLPLQNLNYTFPDTGTHQVKLIVYGDLCSDTLSKSYQISTAPDLLADFNANITSACDSPLFVTFFNESINANEYSWEFGNNKFSQDSAATNHYLESGYFTVKLTVRDTNTNCLDTRTKYEYIKISNPFADIDIQANCDNPLNIHLEDTNSHSGSWLWNIGGHIETDIKELNYTFPSDGIYNITATLTDTSTNCTAIRSHEYNTEKINSSFNLDSFYCFGREIQFENTSTNADSFIWTINEILIDSIASPFLEFENTGLINVQLEAFNKYCSNLITDSFTIGGSKAKFGIELNCSSPTKIHFKDSSESSHLYQWSFDDEDSSVLKNPIHQYESEGIYQVSLTTIDTINNCQNTYLDTLTLIIPNANFNTSKSGLICYSDDSIAFLDNSTGAESWTWNFGDSETSTRQFPKHHYASPGTYSISLIIGANGICKDTINFENFITIQSPISDFTYTIDCSSPDIVNFKDTSTQATSYNWNFGFSSSNSKNPSIEFPGRGTYPVSLTASNISTGCNHTYTDTIIITDIKASLDIEEDKVCFGQKAKFLDQSTDAINWKWQIDSETEYTEQHPSHIYETLGFKNVKLVVQDTNNCKDSIVSSGIVEILGPLPLFDDDHDCIDYYTTSFNNQTTDATSYTWEFDDGIVSYDANPTHTYSAYGTYTVKLTAENKSNNCRSSFEKEVFIFEPNADFTTQSTKTCEGVKVNFTDLSTYPETFHWIFENTDTSSKENPVITFSSKNTYDVFLKYTDINGCQDSLLKDDYITVNSVPQVNFDIRDLKGCIPFTTQFTDQSISDTTITEWNWFFPQTAQTSIKQNPELTFNNDIYTGGGNISVVLKVTNANGCIADSNAENVILSTYPFISLLAERNYCQFDTVSFENHSQGKGLKHKWKFNEDSIISEYPDFTFDQVGEYDFTYILSDTNNCTDTFFRSEFYKVDNPIANFTTESITDKFCPPLFAIFQDSSSSNISKFEWTFGDQTGIGTSSNVSHNYTKAGSYDVKLKITTRGGCVDSIVKENYINITGPQADLTIIGEDEGCKPLDICFSLENLSDVDNYTIFYGDGSVGVSLCHTYKTTGSNIIPTLMLEQTIDNEFCRYTLQAIDTVKIYKIKSDFSIDGDSEGCPPLNAEFTNKSTNAIEWTWLFGDSTSQSGGNDISHNYDSSGLYDVSLIVKDTNDCYDTITRVNAIDVFHIDAIFSADTNKACSPATITFSQSSTSETFISSYQWNFGNGETSDNPLDREVLYEVESPRAFNISLNITDENGCTASHTESINIFTYPEVDFSVDQVILCPLVPLQFENLTDGAIIVESLVWDFQDDTTSNEYHPLYTFKQSGYHDVSLSVTNLDGCTTVETKDSLVFILDYPPLSLSNAEEIENGQSVILEATGGLIYEWTPDYNISNTSSSSPTVYPNVTTSYKVKVTDENDCFVSDSVDILVINPDTSTAIAPTAFTPNNDGINDLFQAKLFKVRRFEIKIYDQDANLLYTTRDQNDGWDGTYRGTPQNPGIYYYIIKAETLEAEEFKTKGSFVLIR